MRPTTLIIQFVICHLLQAQQIDTIKYDGPIYRTGIVHKNEKGAAHGLFLLYDSTGTLRRSEHYSKGIREGEVLGYDANGLLEFRGSSRNNKMHGHFEHYYPDGTVSMEGTFKKGRIHGSMTIYHPNGQMFWSKGYRRNKLDGERIVWDSTGILLEGVHDVKLWPNNELTVTLLFNNGRPNGEFKVPLPNGKLAYSGRYLNGLPHGDWVFYERTGYVNYVDVYWYGKYLKYGSRRDRLRKKIREQNLN
jgi:antitoxin component YwqK of YwqJK toxin-antitoxin module